MNFMIKRFIRDDSGSLSIYVFAIMFVIVAFAMFFMEILRMYSYQYAIEVRVQRAINSTVEYSMDDVFRADGYNVMDTDIAMTKLYPFLREDLNIDASGNCYDDAGNLLYRISFSQARMNSGYDGTSITAPSIGLDVTVSVFDGLGKYMGPNGFRWTNTYKSTNFRTDNGTNAGALSTIRGY